MAFRELGKWKCDSWWWRVHRVGRLDVYFVYLHARLCHTFEPHPGFLLSCLEKAADRRTQVQIKREEEISSKSYQTCLNCHRGLCVLLDSLLGKFFPLNIIQQTSLRCLWKALDEKWRKKYYVKRCLRWWNGNLMENRWRGWKVGTY